MGCRPITITALQLPKLTFFKLSSSVYSSNKEDRDNISKIRKRCNLLLCSTTRFHSKITIEITN